MIIDFAKYSSVRIGPVCEVLCLHESVQTDHLVLGGCNNILLSSSPPPLCVLGEEFAFINKLDVCKEGVLLEVGAATKGRQLFTYARRENLGGLEFLAHIPGQMGGIIKMNAGLKKHEIGPYVRTINDDFIPTFSYRGSDILGIIYKAQIFLPFGFDENLALHLGNIRKNQPKGPSFGSIFKNPKDDFAGRLIDFVGLKGARRGGAMISEKHANFLINTGNASFDDAIYLIELIKKRVFDSCGVRLDEEVKII